MCSFDKKMVYLDYIEEETKVRNVGSGKIIYQGSRLCIGLNISGLYQTDTLKCELWLLNQGENILLDSLLLEKGRCLYSRIFQEKELKEKGITYEESLGIRVKISDKRAIQSIWKEPKKEENLIHAAQEPMQELLRESIQESKWEPIQEPVQESKQEPKQEPIQEPVQEPKREPIQEPIQEPMRVPIKEPIQEPPHEIVQETWDESKEEQGCPQILDDKWRQLEQLYPSVHPFANEKKYLSIEPKDFVILTKAYQPLANNSFLLHGFYNYRHIILGKVEGGDMETYYIGVPGVFYEREKTVAVMFGFESFESGKEPSEVGSFGYYMKRVEI